MFQSLKVLFLLIPDIIKLIHRILDSIEAENKKGQLKQDIKVFNEAIDNNDPARAIELFNKRFGDNSKVQPPVQPHKD